MSQSLTDWPFKEPGHGTFTAATAISLARGKRVDKPHTQIRKLEACCSFVSKKKKCFSEWIKRKKISEVAHQKPTHRHFNFYVFISIYLFVHFFGRHSSSHGIRLSDVRVNNQMGVTSLTLGLICLLCE